MSLLGRLFGFREAPSVPALTRDVDILQSYGLPGYGQPNDLEHECRIWTYDGAELAGDGVPDWILRMAHYLASEGAEVASVSNVAASDGYRILLNGRRYLICLHGELAPTAASVVSAVQIVNELLESARSDERGYILREQESTGLVLFMTAQTYTRLMADLLAVPAGPPLSPGTYCQPSRKAPHIFPPVQILDRLPVKTRP